MRKESRVRKLEKPSEARNGWGEIAPYALLSLGSFVVGLLLIVLVLRNARLLVSLGLEGRFYYLILLPWGLAVTGVLFGALQAFAQYSGNHLGGTLKLGGSIAGLALFVFGGFIITQRESNFPLTVYVHGSAGQLDLPLRNQGDVLLDLGGDRRSSPIGDRGQAFFAEIPSNFRGQKVNVALDASGYERPDNSRLELSGTSLYLEVRRKPTRFVGNVIDVAGNPIVGATVSVAGISTVSMELGRFDLVVPSNRVLDEMVLSITAGGFQPWSEMEPPDGGPVTAVLRR